MPTPARVRIKWVKSSIGHSGRQKSTIQALGLHRVGDQVEKEDHPSIRGMIARVRHLVEVEEVQ